MAHRWIGRDDDSGKTKYPKSSTTFKTKDDDSSDYTTSSSEDGYSSVTSTTYLTEIAETTAIPTSIKVYPPTMSNGPSESQSQYGRPGWSYSYTGPPPWATSADYDDNNHGPFSTITTSYSKTRAYSDQYGLKSTTTPTPTPLQSDNAASPAPTDDDFGLHNHEDNAGPNRTPVYAAAGIVPVVVIIVSFLAFFCLRKRRRQKQAAAERGHFEEMKMRPKPVAMPYVAPIAPPSPPPQAALPQYSPSTPSSSHPPTASSSQPVILGPIPSSNGGTYLTGMDTSDLVSMRSGGGISRQGTVVDRDPFADGRSLEEAPPPYRPSSLPPASLASTSRNSSVRVAGPPHMTSQTQLIGRSPFGDPEDDEISDISGPTTGRSTDAMSAISELSYQIDPVIGRSPF